PIQTTFVFDLGNSCRGTMSSRGQGCLDPQGTPLALIPSGCPDLGASLGLQLRVSAGNTMPVFFMLGVSDTSGLGVTLPLDLGTLGAPGCWLYTSSDVPLGPLTNPGGGSSLPVNVPNNASLLGKSLFWQGIQFNALIPTRLPLVSSGYVVTKFG